MAKYFNFTTGKIETDDDLIYNPKTAETIAKPINISRTPVPTVKAAPNKTNTYGPVQTSKTHALSDGFYQPKTGSGAVNTTVPASKAGAHRVRNTSFNSDPKSNTPQTYGPVQTTKEDALSAGRYEPFKLHLDYKTSPQAVRYYDIPDEQLSDDQVLEKYQAILLDTDMERSRKNKLLKQGKKRVADIAYQLSRGNSDGGKDDIKRFQLAAQIRDEIDRNSLLGSFAIGLFNSASFNQLENPAIASGIMNQFNTDPAILEETLSGLKQANTTAKQAHPVSYGMGQFAGEAAKYKVAGDIVGGIPGLNKAVSAAGQKLSQVLGGSAAPTVGNAASPLLGGALPAGIGGALTSDLMTRLVSGRMVDLPVDTLNAATQNDNVKDFGKQLAADTALGLGTDIGIEAIGAGIKTAGRKIKESWMKDDPILQSLDWNKSVDKTVNGSYNQVGGEMNGGGGETKAPIHRGGMAGLYEKDNRNVLRSESNGIQTGSRTPETIESFLRRASEETKTVQRRGTVDYAYKSVVPEDFTLNAKIAYDDLTSHGIPTEIIDGSLERNSAGFTTRQDTEGITAVDGGVFIRNDTKQAPLVLSGHEKTHSASRLYPEIYRPFHDAVFENNLDIYSPQFTKLADRVIQARFKTVVENGVERPFDLATDYPKLYNEIEAILGGYLNGDMEQARKYFSDWFNDWDSVVASWKAMDDGLKARAKSTPPQSGQFLGLPTEFPKPTLPDDDPLLRAAKGGNPFGKNTVGAAQTNPVSYEHLQNQFGTIPPGELPRAREVDVPLQTAEGNRVRQFTRTAMEAPATPDELIGEFEKGVARGEFSYTPKKDKDSLDMAVKTITDKGYDGALSQWEDVIEGWRAATKDDIVLAQMLYAEAAKAGDVQTAMKLAAEIAAEGTRAGQNVQALRLLKKMTPQGQLYYAERSLQNLQQDLIKRFGDKAPHLSIDENLVQELLSAKGEKAVQAAFDKIAKNIADQIPSSWSDKWNAWRYLSMLGNPRTHVRNIIGNAVFTPVRKLKNLIGAGLENVTDASLKAAGKDGIARTKAVSLPFVDTKIKEYGAKDFDDIKNVITGTGKYNPTDLIQSHKTVFNNRFLEWLRKANEGALDAEDVWFMKNAYVDSFTQYIKANGLDVRTLEKSAEGMQKLGEARKYAILEAQKATFRDANKLADALAKLENTNKITKVGVGGLLPFKKTPANIVKRGLEYSPAGLIKGITYDLAQVKKGAKTAAEAIDQIASGLSGTGIALLGGYLASKGILTGAGSSDKKERTFDRLQGSQNYALNIGDVSYTLDWAAPAALPLFVGVETYNAAKAAKEGFNFTDFADAMLNITEPVFDMTMLDGVNSAIKAAGYDLGNAFSGMGKQVATNYFGQAVPTLSGQIARTIDGTRRTAYHDKNSGVPQWIDEFAQKQAAKLPGATYLLQPYIDAWGRESEPKPIMQRAFENFLSPGYISKRNVTPADEAIGGLYEATGERSVLPTYANKDFTVDNEKLNLSAQQYTDFARQRGQTAKGLIEAVARQKEYQNLALSDQVAIISDIYAYANAIGKTGVSGYQLDGWVKNAYEAQQAGVPLETYLLQRKAYNNLVSEDDNARSDQYREMLFANDALTVQQKTELDKRLIGGENLPDYSSLDNFILSRMSGASQELYRVASVRQAVGSVENYRKVNNILGSVEADKDEYGNAVSGTSKPKAINAIATVLAISWQQAENIYNELCVFDHSISELPSTKRQAYETLSKIGLSGERFLNYYNQTKIISGSKDTNGKTISGSQKQNRYRRLRDLGLTDAQAKKFLKEVYGYKY